MGNVKFFNEGEGIVFSAVLFGVRRHIISLKVGEIFEIFLEVGGILSVFVIFLNVFPGGLRFLKLIQKYYQQKIDNAQYHTGTSGNDAGDAETAQVMPLAMR